MSSILGPRSQQAIGPMTSLVISGEKRDYVVIATSLNMWKTKSFLLEKKSNFFISPSSVKIKHNY